MDANKPTACPDTTVPILPARDATSLSSTLRALVITELLSAIFLHCIAEDGNQSYLSEEWPCSLRLIEGPSRWYPRLSAKEAPLLLTHVCRSWRRTALEIPQLWACLHLDLSNGIGVDSQFPMNKLYALKYWMKLSRELPVSICFTIGSPIDYEMWDRPNSDDARYDSPFVLSFVEELFNHSHRWKTIVVYLTNVFVLPFYYSLDESYPCLKTFEIIPTYRSLDRGTGRDLSLRLAPDLRALALAGRIVDDYVVVPDGIPPRLRSLELTSMGIRFTPCMDGRQLKEIVLKDTTLSAADLARFPSAFPLLEELTVMTSSEHPADRDSVIIEEPIVFDRLIKLKLTSRLPNSFPMRWITAPSLKYIAVKDLFEGNWGLQNQSFEDDILHFLTRSKAPVESFSYSSRVQTGDVYGPMLKEMPRLTALKVEGDYFLPAVLQVLKDPMVCPCLVSIHNESRSNIRGNLWPPSLENVMELIEKRCRKRSDGSNDETVKDGGRDRVYVKEIALPVYNETDLELLKSKTFQEAEVDWKNTYEEDDWYEIYDCEEMN